MIQCSYCCVVAIGNDALGFPVCAAHLDSADNYIAKNSTKGIGAITGGENRFPLEKESLPDIEQDLEPSWRYMCDCGRSEVYQFGRCIKCWEEES